jgi:hypothetical protein
MCVSKLRHREASAGPEPGPTSAMAASVSISMKLLVPLSNNGKAIEVLTCRDARLLVCLCVSADGNLIDSMNAKVFLRNRQTGQYYAGPNGWSGNTSVAHEFETVEIAIELARTQRLEDMEVVLRDHNPACDLILPLKARA